MIILTVFFLVLRGFCKDTLCVLCLRILTEGGGAKTTSGTELYIRVGTFMVVVTKGTERRFVCLLRRRERVDMEASAQGSWAIATQLG